MLICCPHMEENLFVAGAFTRLKRLRVENFCSCLHTDRSKPVLKAAASRYGSPPATLRRIGDSVLSLSKLQQISGGCRLFSIGMEDSLKGWAHTLLRHGDWVSARRSHHKNLWTRS